MKITPSTFNSQYFFSMPPETGIIWFWFGCFVLLMFFTVGFSIYLRSKAVKQRPYKKYATRFFWPNLTLSIVGLILTFSRYEKLVLLSYRFWVYATILFVVIFNAYFFIVKRNELEDELLKFHNNERKQKWMGPKNNKKQK
jgi:uncharacterized protein YacL